MKPRVGFAVVVFSLTLSAPAQTGGGLQVRQLGSFPVDYSLRHNRDFRPSGEMRKLSDHLYVLEDTCNVYAVVRDRRALLVGFGSGEILGKLESIGVNQVEQVVLNHHHRDQAQGLCDLGEYSFEVSVPEKEAAFFEGVEDFWRNLRLYINYDCRSHWNTIRKSIRVHRRMKAGDTLSWEGYELVAADAGGPTDHGLSFLSEIDGRKVAFCGDLISGAGKVPNWFDLHWDYYGFTQGIDASERAFDALAAEKPDLLLPAHGIPIADPVAAIDANRKIYATLRGMLVPNELHRVHEEVRQILPHLVFVGANCYAILSDSGKAFLWDYGYVDRNRIDELKARFKVKRIDVVSFSHYHDDHLIRTYELLREGTRVWVFRNMVDVLEHPIRYRLPCLIPFAIRADRVLEDAERVRWEEYSLEFFHLPGQTEFHQGLAVTIDGKRVLFTGDNTWNKEFPEKVRNGPLVPQNEYFLDGGFIACARKMLEVMPDIVCPAHTEEYAPSRTDLEGFLKWALSLRQVMTSLIDQPDPNFGMDYRWCHFYPYRTETEPERKLTLELRLRNHLFRSAQARIALKLPDGMSCPAAVRSVILPAKTALGLPFEISVLRGVAPGRHVVTADLTMNGHRIGEYAEALIDTR